jgi:hypothetical protein
MVRKGGRNTGPSKWTRVNRHKDWDIGQETKQKELGVERR